MEKDFVEIWEGKSNEELFHILENVVGGEFYDRRAAARILARRKHQPTGELLTEWLRDPEKGIGKIKCSEWGTATTPHEDYYRNDTNEWEVAILAIESLGLIGHELECEETKPLLRKLLDSGEIKGFDLSSVDQLTQWALFRLYEPNEPEINIEDDMILYIATKVRTDFFRDVTFDRLANQMISTHGRDVARGYIEALRKVPDIDIYGLKLLGIVGQKGIQYGNRIN